MLDSVATLKIAKGKYILACGARLTEFQENIGLGAPRAPLGTKARELFVRNQIGCTHCSRSCINHRRLGNRSGNGSFQEFARRKSAVQKLRAIRLEISDLATVAHTMGYPRKVTLAGGGPPAFLVCNVIQSSTAKIHVAVTVGVAKKMASITLPGDTWLERIGQGKFRIIPDTVFSIFLFRHTLPMNAHTAFTGGVTIWWRS